jgi:hypothetical protein
VAILWHRAVVRVRRWWQRRTGRPAAQPTETPAETVPDRGSQAWFWAEVQEGRREAEARSIRPKPLDP